MINQIEYIITKEDGLVICDSYNGKPIINYQIALDGLKLLQKEIKEKLIIKKIDFSKPIRFF